MLADKTMVFTRVLFNRKNLLKGRGIELCHREKKCKRSLGKQRERERPPAYDGEPKTKSDMEKNHGADKQINRSRFHRR